MNRSTETGPSANVGAAHVFRRLFAPRSVCLVGVSANPHKLNGIPLRTLRRHGFPGEIFLVNPKYREIEGLPCVPNVVDLPRPADVALITVPAPEVPRQIEECGRKGIAAAVVLSSGFEEAEGGAALASELREAARRTGILLVGPNCEGVWSVRERFILTFGSAADRDRLVHGPIAVLSQSGSVGGSVVRHLQDAGYGCSYFVSTGNETVVGVLDFLDYLVEQDDVRVVLLFVEALAGGARLPAVAAKARSRGVRIAALKSGASAAGHRAIASHTGKMATGFTIYRDVFRQCGVIQVESLAELIEAGEVLSSLPAPRDVGDRPRAGTAVFSIPGGTRALTADLCERRGVPLAEFDEDTVRRLEARLPQFGHAQNPTDLTGQVLSDAGLFADCLGIVAADANTEALVVQLANRGPRDARKWRSLIRDVGARAGVPVVISFLGDVLPAEERREFAADGIVCARDPADAVRYLDYLYRARAAAALPPPPTRPVRAPVAPVPAADDFPAWARYLAESGIPVPPWRVLGAADDLVDACRQLRFPIAVKALPGDADHKTERGLVQLGVTSVSEAKEAVRDIRSRLGRPNAGVLLQEMVTGGVEAVLSVSRDPDFGAVLTIGTGGQLIELIDDVGHLCLDVDSDSVLRRIADLRLARLLAGFRGAPRADVRGLADAATVLASMFLAAGDALEEIELNPVLVMPEGQGVFAVDLLVKEAGARRARR